MEKPKQIEVGKWLYKGCFIQKCTGIHLIGMYEILKNNKNQKHIGMSYTFLEAKKLCEKK